MIQKNLIPIFTQKSEFCEVSSPDPVETFVPGQAISLSELVTRFERGQRLNVHNNPMNIMYRSDEEAAANSETFDDAAPDDVHDIVDVHEYYRAHESHKKEFTEKQKAKKSKQATQEAKQDVPPATPPPDAPAE